MVGGSGGRDSDLLAEIQRLSAVVYQNQLSRENPAARDGQGGGTISGLSAAPHSSIGSTDNFRVVRSVSPSDKPRGLSSVQVAGAPPAITPVDNFAPSVVRRNPHTSGAQSSPQLAVPVTKKEHLSRKIDLLAYLDDDVFIPPSQPASPEQAGRADVLGFLQHLKVDRAAVEAATEQIKSAEKERVALALSDEKVRVKETISSAERANFVKGSPVRPAKRHSVDLSSSLGRVSNGDKAGAAPVEDVVERTPTNQGTRRSSLPMPVPAQDRHLLAEFDKSLPLPSPTSAVDADQLAATLEKTPVSRENMGTTGNYSISVDGRVSRVLRVDFG